MKVDRLCLTSQRQSMHLVFSYSNEANCNSFQRNLLATSIVCEKLFLRNSWQLPPFNCHHDSSQHKSCHHATPHHKQYLTSNNKFVIATDILRSEMSRLQICVENCRFVKILFVRSVAMTIWWGQLCDYHFEQQWTLCHCRFSTNRSQLVKITTRSKNFDTFEAYTFKNLLANGTVSKMELREAFHGL